MAKKNRKTRRDDVLEIEQLRAACVEFAMLTVDALRQIRMTFAACEAMLDMLATGRMPNDELRDRLTASVARHIGEIDEVKIALPLMIERLERAKTLVASASSTVQ